MLSGVSAAACEVGQDLPWERRIGLSSVTGSLFGWPVLVVVFILSTGILPAAMGQAQQAPGSQDQKRFALAVERTFREGQHAELPPHISSLLGVSSLEKECPVMQRAVRSGTMVQGFDVSLASKNDIVLFVVDEAVNDQTLYLTSARGTLRRVVSVKAGEGRVSPVTVADQKGFEKEKRFWLDRFAPVGALP
jgi:hypothetical protein